MPNTGTGSGPITPDGSPVEFYSLLKPGDEPDIVAQVTPSGGSVLELGSGVGRVTHALVDRGLRVVAVDESAEMLALVRGAETVLARIEELRLGRLFDTVMLASFLVNTADDAARRALLATCARHVRPGGTVLIQWQPAEWHDRRQVGQGRTDGDMTISVEAATEVSPGVHDVTMRYTYGEGRVWTQSFTSKRLTDDDLAADLAAAGLRLARFLTEDRTWVAATPDAFTS